MSAGDHDLQRRNLQVVREITAPADTERIAAGRSRSAAGAGHFAAHLQCPHCGCQIGTEPVAQTMLLLLGGLVAETGDGMHLVVLFPPGIVAAAICLGALAPEPEPQVK